MEMTYPQSSGHVGSLTRLTMGGHVDVGGVRGVTLAGEGAQSYAPESQSPAQSTHDHTEGSLPGAMVPAELRVLQAVVWVVLAVLDPELLQGDPLRSTLTLWPTPRSVERHDDLP